MKRQLLVDGQLATIKALMKRKRRPLTTTRCVAWLITLMRTIVQWILLEQQKTLRDALLTPKVTFCISMVRTRQRIVVPCTQRIKLHCFQRLEQPRVTLTTLIMAFTTAVERARQMRITTCPISVQITRALIKALWPIRRIKISSIC